MEQSPVAQKGLIIGIGNVIRGDDALGPRIIETLNEVGLIKPNLTTIAVPQLDITMVDMIVCFDYVIFIDAGITDTDNEINVMKLNFEDQCSVSSHTTHSITIRSLVELARSLNGKIPDCYLVIVKAYDFKISEILSTKADINRIQAIDRIKEIISLREKIA